jgi:hypothetical protein
MERSPSPTSRGPRSPDPLPLVNPVLGALAAVVLVLLALLVLTLWTTPAPADEHRITTPAEEHHD